jgi:hypothetical protein
MLEPKIIRIVKEPLGIYLRRVGIRKGFRRLLSDFMGRTSDQRGTLAAAISSGVAAFDGIDQSDRLTTIYGTLTPSGSYPAAGGGGDTLSFASLDFIKSSFPPVRVYIQEQPAAGGTPSGYSYVFCPGSTLANGKMALMVGGGASAPATEKTGNPTYASLNLSPLVFEAVFARV